MQIPLQEPSKPKMMSPRSMATAQMIGSVISLQFGSTLAKTLFPVFGPVGVVSLRIGFAALLLGILLRPFRVMSPSSWRAALPYGLSTALMNMFFYLALDRLPVGVTVAIEFIGPLLLGLWHSRSLRDIGWLMLTVAGLFLLLWPRQHVTLDPVGVMEALAASVFWVTYILSGKSLTRLVEPRMAAALGLTAAALFVSPLLLWTLGTAGVAHPGLLPAGIGVAIFSSALPYTLECLAMSRLSSRDLGILYSLEPVAATCAGFFLLGESLSLSQIAGIGGIVAASAGVVLMGGNTEELEPPP